ncbi:hypothetical protein PV721_32635 [Streptomyces sp. MB09-01]|uniref:hypothetical protein n=1 Tax=Streptomyces sp. MB09-01 TaxID=3028666 RepID=UPI0029A3BC1F|nr:hypothetical protein [Streptomyces sp. MB09-01]MDX3538997.1 hypothetical protein [Streptomyces sp. MB09-01]
MEQKTVSPPQWADFARLAQDVRQRSDAPIYDALERLWLTQGREVPRRPGPSLRGRNPVNPDDLFRRG